MATDYGKRLRQARISAKLTQEQASALAGIPQSTISTAERLGHGSSETPVYARVYGVSALWLAKGEGEMRPVQTDPPAASAGEASSTAMELALLYDLIPVADRLRRVKAYNAATKAILDVLEAQPSTDAASSDSETKQP